MPVTVGSAGPATAWYIFYDGILPEKFCFSIEIYQLLRQNVPDWELRPEMETQRLSLWMFERLNEVKEGTRLYLRIRKHDVHIA